MRKILPALLIIVTVIGLMISCQKNRDVNGPDVNEIMAQKLSANSDFNQYSDNFNALIDSTLKRFSKDQIESLITKIEIAKTQNMSIEEQYAFLTKEFQLSDQRTFIKAAKIIFPSYKRLQSHLKGGLTEDVFEKATRIKNNRDLQVKTIGMQETPSTATVAESGGGWRYSLCAASVSFQGGLLLAACEAASGGVATPLCLAGAVAYAADGIAECADKYL